jgi:hypothetical protein
MFTMDLSPVLARPYVVQNVASQWRLEHLMDRSIRLVKGISLETLVFDLRESSVRNASCLEVVCEQPEHCVLDKFYRLAEHREVASRIDPMSKVIGISYPQFMDRVGRGLVWCYENMDGLTVGDM